ncbi:hypothetical protein [Streptomyces sp. NPDC001435]|uniref:hypothetical protein n=1 Tax=unclassified Streptomyces TaxID=2593676 RepID=UPI003692A25D
MRTTCQSTLAFLVMLLAVDTCAGTLNAIRAVLWTGLALLLFLVLAPPRVETGEGWLRPRWLWREHLVRTDRLVSVRWSQRGAQRVILRDADGARIEVGPEVLAADPALWRLVETGARASSEQGRLWRGHSALRKLSRRIDSETALAIFRISGLHEDGGSAEWR